MDELKINQVFLQNDRVITTFLFPLSCRKIKLDLYTSHVNAGPQSYGKVIFIIENRYSSSFVHNSLQIVFWEEAY